MKPIRLYWWRGEGENNPTRRNFGDYLSPLIVEMIARRPVVHSPVDSADMLAIGTILSKARKARCFLFPRKLHIWGSGAGDISDVLPERHYYHAVRGEHSLARIKGSPDSVGHVALGDPGLLVSEYWANRPRPPKRYALGVIPHFVDQGSPAVQALLGIRGARLINVFAPIDDVLSDVLSCAYILSSSLHGLIVSDAFGIPNRRVVISNNIRSNLKFADYYSAFGLAEPDPLVNPISSEPRDIESLVGNYLPRDMNRVCTNLIRAFPHL